ncbi:MAG: UDP-N-acetylmuramoyl-tripeptide--D-alanyl-D-alanine ligase [Mariprofundaceae bacterium]
MSGAELQSATAGRWLGAVAGELRGLSTDSRALNAGDAFLALTGPHFDGHAYHSQAVAGGASALIGAEGRISGWDAAAVPVLAVDDTLEALGAIAAAWRGHFSARVLAITGAYGKTTVRSMLDHVLTRLGWRVAATRANNNNLIGVPQTLLAAGGDEDIVIVECGISEPGEMARLASITQPDMTVLTGLALAHAEQLGDVAGVAREKARLLRATSQWCALGEGVADQLREYGLMPETPCMSMDGPDAVGWRLDGNRLHLMLGDTQAACDLALPALHWAANMALTATVVLRQDRGGIALADVAHALEGWQPPAGRLRPLAGPNGSHIYDDAYNANPVSMAAALDTLRRLPGRRLAILGDMLELGAFAGQAHASLDVSGLDGLILVGPHMQALGRLHREAICVADVAEALDAASGWRLGPEDHLLVKASRGMGLDRVVRALTEDRHAV